MRMFQGFIKKISVIVIVCSFFVVSSVFGMRIQADKLFYTALEESKKDGTTIQDLKKVLKKEIVNLGSNLEVIGWEDGNSYTQTFNLAIFNKLSGQTIGEFKVVKSGGNLCVERFLEANKDGCIISSIDKKLEIGRAKEAYFMMNKTGRKISQATIEDFVKANKNDQYFYRDGQHAKASKHVYAIRSIPSLQQPVSGPCGYYATFNILRLFRHHKKFLGISSYDFMMNRSLFEKTFLNRWENYIGKNSLSNEDIVKIFQNKVFYNIEGLKTSFTISGLGLNEFNDRKISTLDGRSLTDKIKDFRTKGTSQYLIIGTDSPNDKKIWGIDFSWDDRNNRRACIKNHWLAVKIEWMGKPQTSPIMISVADSGGPKDNRFAALIHWYYYIFTHLDLA